jgi:magnesium transporter
MSQKKPTSSLDPHKNTLDKKTLDKNTTRANSRDSLESVDSVDFMESLQTVESLESVESVNSKDSVDFMNSVESKEPLESTKSLDSEKSLESRDSLNSKESTKSTESVTFRDSRDSKVFKQTSHSNNIQDPQEGGSIEKPRQEKDLQKVTKETLSSGESEVTDATTIPESPLDHIIRLWPAMSLDEKRESFSTLSRGEAEELFLTISALDQSELLLEVSPSERRSWVRLLPPDDVADLIQELNPSYRDSILNLLDNKIKREVSALLAFAEDVAGGLMNSQFIRLRHDMTVDEAISYLRRQARTSVEVIYYMYVLDSQNILVGTISFRELFMSQGQKHIRDIMKTDLITIPLGLDQEEVAKIFSQSQLLALPVTDQWGQMKGIVTFDDIANVLKEEATEDFQKYGGVETLDSPYMKTSILELLRKRVGWLLVLFVSQMFTASAMGYYHHEIEKALILALFVPLIISSGGNSGSQASTLIIRAIALGELRLQDWGRVLKREILMGLGLGFILGAIGALRIIFWPNRESLYGEHFTLVGMTVGLSVLGCVLWGTLAGSMLPFFLKKAKLDPATASAPFIATLVDVTGIMIYFTIAGLLLKGALL